MDILPHAPEDFGSIQYWNSFYKRRKGPFDWYVEFDVVAAVVLANASPSHKFLNVGCGTSRLEIDLCNMGYGNVHSVDYDKRTIDSKLAHNSVKTLSYACEDATNLTCPSESFDFGIDKGTIDAIVQNSSGREGIETAMKVLDEVMRCLQPGDSKSRHGRHFIISLADRNVISMIFEYLNSRRNITVLIHHISVDESNRRYSVYVFELTKLRNPFPGTSALHCKYQTGSGITDMVEDALFDLIDSDREHNYLVSMARKRLSSPMYINYYALDGITKRWTLYIFDRSYPKTYKVIILPPNTIKDLPETNEDAAACLNFDYDTARVFFAQQEENQEYDHEDMICELQEIISALVPFTTPKLGQICYYTDNAEKLERTVAQEYDSTIGHYTVADYRLGMHVNRRLIFDANPNIIQSEARLSVVNPDNCITVELFNEYHSRMVSCIEFRPGGLREKRFADIKMAVLGLGGGLLVSFLACHFTNVEITAVELIGKLFDIARNYFCMPATNNIIDRVMDARDWLMEPNDDKQEIIFVDLGDSTSDADISCPPPEFVDPNFIHAYKNRLIESGVLIVNVVARNFGIVEGIIENFRRVFLYVGISVVGGSTNYVLAASDAKFAANPAPKRKEPINGVIVEVISLASSFHRFSPLAEHFKSKKDKNQKKKTKQQKACGNIKKRKESIPHADESSAGDEESDTKKKMANVKNDQASATLNTETKNMKKLKNSEVTKTQDVSDVMEKATEISNSKEKNSCVELEMSENLENTRTKDEITTDILEKSSEKENQPGAKSTTIPAPLTINTAQNAPVVSQTEVMKSPSRYGMKSFAETLGGSKSAEPSPVSTSSTVFTFSDVKFNDAGKDRTEDEPEDETEWKEVRKVSNTVTLKCKRCKCVNSYTQKEIDRAKQT